MVTSARGPTTRPPPIASCRSSRTRRACAENEQEPSDRVQLVRPLFQTCNSSKDILKILHKFKVGFSSALKQQIKIIQIDHPINVAVVVICLRHIMAGLLNRRARIVVILVVVAASDRPTGRWMSARHSDRKCLYAAIY